LLYLEPEQFKVEQFLKHIEPQAKQQSARYALKALYTQMLRVNSIALIGIPGGTLELLMLAGYHLDADMIVMLCIDLA
jgi:hypothetical protein